MKREVVIDGSGRILGSGPHPDDVEPNEEYGVYRGFIPQDGQEVHAVELPDSTSDEDLAEMLTSHRVRVENGRAVLEATQSEQ